MPSAPGLVDPHVAFLSPWLRIGLVIRQIRSTTWDAANVADDEGDAPGRAAAAAADAAVGVVELMLHEKRWPTGRGWPSWIGLVSYTIFFVAVLVAGWLLTHR